VETGCRAGQGSPRAVAPTGRQAGRFSRTRFLDNGILVYDTVLSCRRIVTVRSEDACNLGSKCLE
jgi:hypothetical protein